MAHTFSQLLARLREFIEGSRDAFVSCSLPDAELRLPICALGTAIGREYVGVHSTDDAPAASVRAPIMHANEPREPILRPFLEADANAAADLIARAMNADEGAYAEKTFREYFASRANAIDDGRELFVLADGDKIIGITGLHHYVWGPPTNVWLSWFAVEPDVHGRGLGTRLMAATLELARERGFTQLFIETYSSPTFEKARAFYAARGFEQVGGIRGYMPDGSEMVVFRRAVSP